MNKRQISTFFAMGSVAALAACGGGSGNDVTMFTSFEALPDTGVTQMQGQAVTADFENNGTGIDVSNQEGPSAATALITTENGEITAFSVQGPGSSVSFSAANGDTFEVEDGYIIASNSDESVSAIFSDPETMNFNYQTYGIWGNGATDSGGSFGAATLGALAPSSGIPTGSGATYTGESIGVITADINTAFNGIITAVATVTTTDFETLTFATTGSTLEPFDDNFPEQPLSGADLSGTATISGSEFAGTIDSAFFDGDLSGGFYGPNAEEVGGVFSTTTLSGGNELTYNGAFGGTKQ